MVIITFPILVLINNNSNHTHLRPQDVWNDVAKSLDYMYMYTCTYIYIYIYIYIYNICRYIHIYWVNPITHALRTFGTMWSRVWTCKSASFPGRSATNPPPTCGPSWATRAPAATQTSMFAGARSRTTHATRHSAPPQNRRTPTDSM